MLTAFVRLNILEPCSLKTEYDESIKPLRERRKMYRRQKIRINGKERWISFKSTQDLVDKVLELYAAECKSDSVLLGDYLLHWFESYKRPMLEYNTANNYHCMIKNHILPVMGKKLIAEVDVEDVQQIMSRLH